jgi:ComF family protein
MKDQRNERLAFAVGGLLAERVDESLASADVIVPVPMTWRRRWVRQVNGPESMADALSRSLGIRQENSILSWGRNVAVQSSLPPSARRQNVSDALRVRSGCDLSGAHILLVDDIMTTGATANAATRVLRRAGASRVSLAVAARGIGAT